MRQKAAFVFIPELVGDFFHVMEVSGNPRQLYIEAAVRTLHMGGDLIRAITEHKSTEEKIRTKKQIEEAYDSIKREKLEYYEEEVLSNIDISYQKIKQKISEGQFRDKEVRSFIKLLEKELQRLFDAFSGIQVDSDLPEASRIDEVARKSLRDYKKLLSLFIEEENNG